MHTGLVDQFSAAYAGSEVDPASVKAVYGQWVALRLQSTAGLPESLQADVLSRLVQDRCREIARAPDDAKGSELEADRIWTELWPLDRRSEDRAEALKQGTSSTVDRPAALTDREQLETIEARVRALPPELRSQFAETLSEATLDVGYVLTGGTGPSSLRLGRSR